MTAFSDLPVGDRRAILRGRQQIRDDRGYMRNNTGIAQGFYNGLLQRLLLHVERLDHMLVDQPGISGDEVEARLSDTPNYRFEKLWRDMAEETDPNLFYSQYATTEGTVEGPSPITFVDATSQSSAANTNTITVSTPQGQAGDVMLLILANDSTGPIPTQSGWIAVDAPAAPNVNLRARAFYRVRTANEPSSHTFDFNASALRRLGMIHCYRSSTGFAPTPAALATTTKLYASGARPYSFYFNSLTSARDNRLVYLIAAHNTDIAGLPYNGPGSTFEMINRLYRTIDNNVPGHLSVSAYDAPVYDNRFDTGGWITPPSVHWQFGHRGAALFPIRLIANPV